MNLNSSNFNITYREEFDAFIQSPNSYWLAKEDGHLEGISWFRRFVEGLKSWFDGRPDRASKAVVEYEVIRILSALAEEKAFSKADLTAIQLAAKRCGLVPGDRKSESNHPELYSLFVGILKSLNNPGTDIDYQKFAVRYYLNHKDELNWLPVPKFEWEKVTHIALPILQEEIPGLEKRRISSIEKAPPDETPFSMEKLLSSLETGSSTLSQNSNFFPKKTAIKELLGDYLPDPSDQNAFDRWLSDVFNIAEGISKEDIKAKRLLFDDLPKNLGFSNAFALAAKCYQLAHCLCDLGGEEERQESENSRLLFKDVLENLVARNPSLCQNSDLDTLAFDKESIPSSFTRQLAETEKKAEKSRQFTQSTLKTLGFGMLAMGGIYQLWNAGSTNMIQEPKGLLAAPSTSSPITIPQTYEGWLGQRSFNPVTPASFQPEESVVDFPTFNETLEEPNFEEEIRFEEPVQESPPSASQKWYLTLGGIAALFGGFVAGLRRDRETQLAAPPVQAPVEKRHTRRELLRLQKEMKKEYEKEASVEQETEEKEPIKKQTSKEQTEPPKTSPNIIQKAKKPETPKKTKQKKTGGGKQPQPLEQPFKPYIPIPLEHPFKYGYVGGPPPNQPRKPGSSHEPLQAVKKELRDAVQEFDLMDDNKRNEALTKLPEYFDVIMQAFDASASGNPIKGFPKKHIDSIYKNFEQLVTKLTDWKMKEPSGDRAIKKQDLNTLGAKARAGEIQVKDAVRSIDLIASEEERKITLADNLSCISETRGTFQEILSSLNEIQNRRVLEKDSKQVNSSYTSIKGFVHSFMTLLIKMKETCDQNQKLLQVLQEESEQAQPVQSQENKIKVSPEQLHQTKENLSKMEKKRLLETDRNFDRKINEAISQLIDFFDLVRDQQNHVSLGSPQISGVNATVLQDFKELMEIVLRDTEKLKNKGEGSLKKGNLQATNLAWEETSQKELKKPASKHQKNLQACLDDLGKERSQSIPPNILVAMSLAEIEAASSFFIKIIEGLPDIREEMQNPTTRSPFIKYDLTVPFIKTFIELLEKVGKLCSSPPSARTQLELLIEGF